MSTTIDPITTYADYVAASNRQHALREEMRGLDDRDRRDLLNAEHKALTDAMYDGPQAELLRIMWLFDNWERSTVPPEVDEDGVVSVFASNDERDELVTTAEDIRWLVAALVAELRRLRPELAGGAA